MASMTKWSLGYEILRFFFRGVFKSFYKNVQIHGKHNIPKDKPVIFAPNHQNALMDPLAVIFTNPKQSVFLTRSDVFNNPILLKIFTFFKMLPVYRIRDGIESLKNNERIFNKSVDILEANMPIALFPEAMQTDKRHLMPLKKAVPRIAFLAEEKNDFELDLQIVPVGIYYEDLVLSNHNLLVNYGEPITLRQFKEAYLENQQKGYAALKKKMEEAIIPLIIHIKDMDNYELYERIRVFFRPEMRKKLGLRADNPKNNFKADQKTIEKIHQYYNSEERNIEELAQDFQTLDKLNESLCIDLTPFKHTGFFNLLLKSISLLIGLPVFIYGLVNHFLYFYILQRMLKRIKDKLFHTSVKFGVILLISPIIYLIHFFAFYAISGDWQWATLYFISLPISAYWANKYKYFWRNYTKSFRYWKLSLTNKNAMTALAKQVKKITGKLHQVIS